MDGQPVCDFEVPYFLSCHGSTIKSDLADTSTDQSGPVPASGSHTVPLNLDLHGRYPISCHLGFDDLNHEALTTETSNSGTFNITNVPDNNPNIIGPSTSVAAPAATASKTTSSAPTSATTVVVNDTTVVSTMSQGEIAGLVIGVLFGVGIILGILIYLCLRKRRRNRRRKGEATSVSAEEAKGTVTGPTDFFAGEMAADEKQKSELPADTKPVMEKDGVQQPAELSTEREPEGPVEMEGNNTFLGRLRGKSLKR